MAPVAARIADGEKDQLAFLLRLGQRLLAPRKPINRIMGVLQEIGTRLLRQAIGVLRQLILRLLSGYNSHQDHNHI